MLCNIYSGVTDGHTIRHTYIHTYKLSSRIRYPFMWGSLRLAPMIAQSFLGWKFSRYSQVVAGLKILFCNNLHMHYDMWVWLFVCAHAQRLSITYYVCAIQRLQAIDVQALAHCVCSQHTRPAFFPEIWLSVLQSTQRVNQFLPKGCLYMTSYFGQGALLSVEIAINSKDFYSACFNNQKAHCTRSKFDMLVCSVI